MVTEAISNNEKGQKRLSKGTGVGLESYKIYSMWEGELMSEFLVQRGLHMQVLHC